MQVIPAAKGICNCFRPSHATFWRPWVESMTCKIVSAGADGVMLEVHPKPSQAAVDPLQPINYSEFKIFLK